MAESVVFMGVSGCGKSSLACAAAARLGLVPVEGDDFHSAASRAKMAQGTALTDDDRAAWLEALGSVLSAHSQAQVPVALSCSALKRSYRDALRASSPGLRFVFLAIDPREALHRVRARAGAHFFSPNLVDSQFATLEDPTGEPGVLRVDATAPLVQLLDQVQAWWAVSELPTVAAVRDTT